jgi:Ring finger domain
VAIVLPDLRTDTGPAGIVNDSFGFQLQASEAIRTLSANNPNNFDMIQGLLYVPDVSTVNGNGCSQTSLDLIPFNITRKTDLPADGYSLIAIAPWTDPSCVQSYLSLIRMDAARGVIFFQNDSSSTKPPPVSDRIWNLHDGGRWKGQNQFPVYAIPATIGTALLHQLSLYSGNMSSAPYGDELVQIYDPNDSVKLFTRITISSSAGIPSLWVFLIIVLAILLAVVLTTSIVMHMIQRRQRTLLARRVARGEVDLEALGIKRLNVPQEILDKMPQYTYTSKTEALPPTMTKVGTKEVPFSQPTCPICLDDFVHGETTIRELPCNHIFHPECIDPFLKDNSSLCPMCKKSALPAGFCPVTVTNLMVRRERLVRRMRERNRPPPPTSSNPVVAAMQRRVRSLSTPGPGIVTHNPRAFASSPQNGDAEMVNMDAAANTTHPATTNDELPATPAPAAGTSAAGRRSSVAQGLRRGTFIESRRGDVDEVPEEIRAQGTQARRAWLRERLARRQQEQYNENSLEARDVDINRPLCEFRKSRILTDIC